MTKAFYLPIAAGNAVLDEKFKDLRNFLKWLHLRPRPWCPISRPEEEQHTADWVGL
jgi:hypothetical protein